MDWFGVFSWHVGKRVGGFETPDEAHGEADMLMKEKAGKGLISRSLVRSQPGTQRFTPLPKVGKVHLCANTYSFHRPLFNGFAGAKREVRERVTVTRGTAFGCSVER